MEGLSCGIITHPPTDNELHECQRILLSYEIDWDTPMELFETSSMEEEHRTSSIFHRYINIVDRRVPSTPPNIQCRDYLVIHEFDIAMQNVSIGLSQDLMVDILIINVRVKRTSSGFETYTYKQHHGVSTDLLEIKWCIGLYKANQTLQ